MTRDFLALKFLPKYNIFVWKMCEKKLAHLLHNLVVYITMYIHDFMLF